MNKVEYWLLLIACLLGVANTTLSTAAATQSGDTKTGLTIAAACLGAIGLVATLLQKFWIEPSTIINANLLAILDAMVPPVDELEEQKVLEGKIWKELSDAGLLD